MPFPPPLSLIPLALPGFSCPLYQPNSYLSTFFPQDLTELQPCIIPLPGEHPREEVIVMAKQGMARPDWTKRPRNSAAGAGDSGEGQNYQNPSPPHHRRNLRPPAESLPQRPHSERPISPAHGIIDTDLSRDNLENDIPAADLEDL